MWFMYVLSWLSLFIQVSFITLAVGESARPQPAGLPPSLSPRRRPPRWGAGAPGDPRLVLPGLAPLLRPRLVLPLPLAPAARRQRVLPGVTAAARGAGSGSLRPAAPRLPPPRPPSRRPRRTSLRLPPALSPAGSAFELFTLLTLTR